MNQTTWINLLGNDSTNCTVSGLDIVRKFNDNKFTVLWSFETSESAWECFYAWMRELIPAPSIRKLNDTKKSWQTQTSTKDKS